MTIDKFAVVMFDIRNQFGLAICTWSSMRIGAFWFLHIEDRLQNCHGALPLQESNLSQPTPVAVACLICDRVIIDNDVGDRTIVGIYDHISFELFPASVTTVLLYIKVIEGQGDYNVAIDYLQVATQEILERFESGVSFHDRQSYNDFEIDLGELTFPDPGEYEFKVWMNGRFVTSVRLMTHLDEEDGDNQ